MMNLQEFEEMLEASLKTVRPQIVLGLEEIGLIAERAAKSYIGHEHSEIGQQDHPEWPPLAESTIADKHRKGYPTPSPLLRDGTMRASIQQEVDPAQLELVVGSKSPIAKFQEAGTSRIPPRPFLEPGIKHALPHVEEIFGKIAMTLLAGEKIK